MLNQLRSILIAALLAAGVSVPASAGPLHLASGLPDVTVAFLDFKYVSLDSVTSGDACGAGPTYTLCFKADPAAISTSGLPVDFEDLAPVLLAAAVRPDGTLANPGGILTVGNYLYAEIIDFGYQFSKGKGNANANLEFLAAVTGGSLAPYFAPIVGIKGTIYGFGGLGSNYSKSDVNADLFFVVPEPASIGLLALGLALVRANRRRQRHTV